MKFSSKIFIFIFLLLQSAIACAKPLAVTGANGATLGYLITQDSLKSCMPSPSSPAKLLKVMSDVIQTTYTFSVNFIEQRKPSAQLPSPHSFDDFNYWIGPTGKFIGVNKYIYSYELRKPLFIGKVGPLIFIRTVDNYVANYVALSENSDYCIYTK